MAIKVNVTVAKSAGPDVQAAARVTAAQVLARVASLNEEAAALGLDLEIKKVDLKHVAKAATAAPSWPADLADPTWRP